MSIIKIITSINWLLAAIYGGFVLWALLQASKPSHEIPGLESVIKGVGVFLLLVLVGLNLLPYSWSKVIGCMLGVLLLMMVRHIATH
jgi:hypothetical protein